MQHRKFSDRLIQCGDALVEIINSPSGLYHVPERLAKATGRKSKGRALLPLYAVGYHSGHANEWAAWWESVGRSNGAQVPFKPTNPGAPRKFLRNGVAQLSRAWSPTTIKHCDALVKVIATPEGMTDTARKVAAICGTADYTHALDPAYPTGYKAADADSWAKWWVDIGKINGRSAKFVSTVPMGKTAATPADLRRSDESIRAMYATELANAGGRTYGLLTRVAKALRISVCVVRRVILGEFGIVKVQDNVAAAFSDMAALDDRHSVAQPPAAVSVRGIALTELASTLLPSFVEMGISAMRQAHFNLQNGVAPGDVAAYLEDAATMITGLSSAAAGAQR